MYKSKRIKFQRNGTPGEYSSLPTSWGLSRYRTTKYKQRRELITSGNLRGNLAVGACTGLSLGWIQRHRNSPIESGAERVRNLGSWEVNDARAGRYNGRVGSPPRDRVAAMLVNENLRISTTGGFRFDNLAIFSKQAVENGYHLIHLETNATNHICAAYVHEKGMIFFDPNFGDFSVKTSNFSAFIGQLKYQYLKHHVSSDGVKTEVTITWMEFVKVVDYV